MILSTFALRRSAVAMVLSTPDTFSKRTARSGKDGVPVASAGPGAGGGPSTASTTLTGGCLA
jgi:hypothetical protein